MVLALDPAPFKAYFDRDVNNVNGLFSIVDASGVKVFNRLPVRSGQAGFTHTSWTSGKSPIPFSKELSAPLRILLNHPNQEGQWPATPGGIGEFWLITNVPGTDLIRGKEAGHVRQAIGCHPENAYRGSAGCIVFLHDTQTQKDELLRLTKWSKQLIGHYGYIPLEVL